LYLLVDFTTNTGDIEGSRAYLALMHERAQNLSDQISEARALAVAATAALLRQEYRESYELSSQALALQIATNDREAEAATRSRLAAAATWLGDFRTALREFDLALASYESIGNKRGQAIVYTNRAMLLLRLGLFAESLQSIERSNELFATVNEQRTIVANRVNASFAMLQLGDAASAKELARSALDDAKVIGMPVFEAGALSNLGNAERALGEIEAATLHAEAAIEIRRRVQDPRDIVDDLADLILTYISAGRPADALAVALELETIGQGGSFWQHYVYWAMAQGFEAGGRPDRARDAAEKARAELAAFAAGIEDDATRATFMSVPINARIARST
jgi:tetratricopeptide (TPR) repeat protein